MSTTLALQPISADDGVPQYEGSSGYSGPSPGWLIENHKLAHQIIACHSIPPLKVLDSPSLVLLKRYVEYPAGSEELLKQLDMWDKEGDKAGTRANQKYGNLAGYVIASGGFDEGEIGLLKEWFGSGVLDKELEGVGLDESQTVMPGWNGD